MRSIVLCVVLALVATSLAVQTSYDNFKVFQVTPKTIDELNIVKGFEKIETHVDFWSEARATGKPIDIMVSPMFQAMFTNTLNYNNISYNELIQNVETVFKAERLRQVSTPKTDNGKINLAQYQRYSAIQSYLDDLVKENPDIVSIWSPGQSTEGRDIYMLKISTGGDAKKPAILIDGGIHAREWIAPAMVLYIINQLVENKDNRHMIENVDWFIIPSLNPDGYEFSHTNTRLWRKTRSPGRLCYGTDANRNFDFHWMEIGASSSECSETYAGPTAMSEPEAGALGNVVNRYGDQIKLYLTFHSYGNYLLYPWGWTSALPENWKELDGLAQDVNNAISAVDGTSYEIGSSTNVLYAAAGGSDDWVKAKGGVELSYTIELPGGGSSGFDLPPSRILPVVKETWEGMKVYHSYIEKKFSQN